MEPDLSRARPVRIPEVWMNMLNEAKALSAWLTGIRRELHMRPEVGLDLPVTAALVMRELDAIGIPYAKNKGIGCVIQRYCLHDGPGIRTAVFFKGCPLQCAWCSNPESQSALPELLGKALCGTDMTAQEIAKAVLADKPFFDGSGGGVTFTGGEPVSQAELCEKTARLLLAQGVDLALETSGYGPWEDLFRVARLCRTVYFDIKAADGELHRQATGADNRVILKNFARLAASHAGVVVRTPLIPDFNMDEGSIEAIWRLASSAGIKEMELLPYHALGVHKYKLLGRPAPQIRPVGEKELDAISRIARRLSEKGTMKITIIR